MTSRLDKLEALEKAATAGPWRKTKDNHVDTGHEIYGEGDALVAGNYDWEDGGIAIDCDREFLVALRNNAAALIAVARAADQYLAEMGNPSPCHVMRKQYRQAMHDALARLEGGE